MLSFTNDITGLWGRQELDGEENGPLQKMEVKVGWW